MTYVHLASTSPSLGPPKRQKRTNRGRAAGWAMVGVITMAALVVLVGVRSNASKASGSSPVDRSCTGAGHIDQALNRAFARASSQAHRQGVELVITSGYRSPELQQELYEQAIVKYGSPERARAWVLPPCSSSHVFGNAIDVGPTEGSAWLDRYGVRYGLCRPYANESWHFELLAPRKGEPCPAMKANAGVPSP